MYPGQGSNGMQPIMSSNSQPIVSGGEAVILAPSEKKPKRWPIVVIAILVLIAIGTGIAAFLLTRSSEVIGDEVNSYIEYFVYGTEGGENQITNDTFNINPEDYALAQKMESYSAEESSEYFDKLYSKFSMMESAGKEKINAFAEYIDSKASSVTEIISKYIIETKNAIDNITATIMLAGIEIDTNCFNIKTTEETFKVAAWLMKMGADNILKQNILKENKDEYIKRTKQIEQSYLINDNLMICVLDENTYNPSYLATLSEDLLRFDNVEASFTIGKLTNDKIGISARSLGDINVEEYMSLLGGGGHKTDAACQLELVSLEEAENQLTQILTKQKGKTK